MSRRRRQGERLTRLANWLLFRGWPGVRRWLRVLHRLALVVALVLSLLAVLTTICQHGLGDRPQGVGAGSWTTRVWAADQHGGVTIRATTGRALPYHGPRRCPGRLLGVALQLLAVVAVVTTAVMILLLLSGTPPIQQPVAALPEADRSR